MFSEGGSAPCRAREIPQTPKIADCSRVSVMALATLCALKSPGATLSVDRRRVVRQTTCGKPRRLSRDDATSTEHGTEHREASHDMFRLAWHGTLLSPHTGTQFRTERAELHGHSSASYHVGPRASPPRWHLDRLLSLGSAVGRGKMWSLWR